MVVDSDVHHQVIAGGKGLARLAALLRGEEVRDPGDFRCEYFLSFLQPLGYGVFPFLDESGIGQTMLSTLLTFVNCHGLSISFQETRALAI